MKLDLIFPALPPALDGIGDYTAKVAFALAREHHVRILTAQEGARPIEGVETRQAFSLDSRSSIGEIVGAIENEPPEWAVLQFNQFSYGQWGLNPFVPLVLFKLRRQVPGVRIAIMFHEDFVPVTSWKNAIMTTWQRAQFLALGRLADVAMFSIQPWAEKYRSWFPNTAVHHVPVGSNIPYTGISRQAAREVVGVEQECFVVGIFGTLHASRMLPLIRKALLHLYQREKRFRVLYVGPDGDRLSALLAGLPLVDAGRLPAEDVAIHLAAMDVHLAPFIDGLSTRRGSAIAGMQQGIPTVSTAGPLTDDMLKHRDGDAFLLAPLGDDNAFVQSVIRLYEDGNLRAHMDRQARMLFDEHFSWSVIASRYADALSEFLASTSA